MYNMHKLGVNDSLIYVLIKFKIYKITYILNYLQRIVSLEHVKKYKEI